ncbi:hypothetical protein EVC11_045 [Rhizobium phage RHph_I20]|uniref:Uncharacterized protein n=1 Tax=Rhizobium phage RHph_I20 TaxID=2509730 RepID=A0A7S5RBK5_9CAUD|nr:hypothetical protein EVC11_045 [Rhizobium phage RHph_I20]
MGTVKAPCLICNGLGFTTSGLIHQFDCKNCEGTGYSIQDEATVKATKVKSDGSSTSYYDLPPAAKDLGDLIEFKNMNFNVGNIFKACYRLGEKEGNDLRYDLNKIIYFAQRELARAK